jgi:hypothetical protein
VSLNFISEIKSAMAIVEPHKSDTSAPTVIPGHVVRCDGDDAAMLYCTICQKTIKPSSVRSAPLIMALQLCFRWLSTSVADPDLDPSGVAIPGSGAFLPQGFGSKLIVLPFGLKIIYLVLLTFTASLFAQTKLKVFVVLHLPGTFCINGFN